MKPKFLKSALLIIICILTSAPAFAGGHEKVLGIQTGYISRNRSAEAGLFFQYSFSRVVRASLDVSMAIRSHERDALLVDLNAQFPLLQAGRWEFYPLVGINYSTWALHEIVFNDESGVNGIDVSDRHGRFGINAGIGTGLRVTPSLKLKAEALYTGVKSNNAARVMVGIGYSF